MEYCSSCGKDVSSFQERKQRRLLSSSTLQPVFQTLMTFICKLNNQESLQDVRGGFICRPCVRLIEKCNKVHEKVVSNVIKALPILKKEANSTVLQDQIDLPCRSSVNSTSQPNLSPILPAFSITTSVDSVSSPPVCATPIPKHHPQATDTGSPALTVIN